MFRLPTLLATAAATVAVIAPAAQAAPPLASVPHAVSVSTYQDTIAWSSYANGGYQLTIDRAGTVAAANVPASKTAFDVDLGTDASGATVAVYSRAGKLYEYDLATNAEHALKLTGAQPTIMAGRLAYVSGGKLYLRQGSHSQAVFEAKAIRDPELSATRLAFVTTSGTLETLHLQTLNGKAKSIYTARSGGLNQADIVEPTFDASGAHLFWARRNLGSGNGNRYVRRTVATGKTSYAMGTDKLFSLSWVDDATGFVVAQTDFDDDASAPGDGVTLITTGALSFNAHA